VPSKHSRSGSQAFDRVRWLCDDAQKPARGKHAHSNRGWWPAIRNRIGMNADRSVLANDPTFTSCLG
jgi:hypothetical protein